MNKVLDTTKKNNEIYCPECGKHIKRNAVICVHCGTQIKEMVIKPVKKNVMITPKSKSLALILSFLLGFWAWLYTYGKNKIKFWICAGVFIFFFFINFIYSCSAALTDPYTLKNQSYGFTIFIWILGIGFWIWSMADNGAKSKEFYEQYPTLDK